MKIKLFRIVTLAIIISLFSQNIVLGDYGATHNNIPNNNCNGQDCVSFHNGGYTHNNYHDGTRFPTFNGYKDKRTEDNQDWDERQFMYIESEYADHDGSFPNDAGSPWDDRGYWLGSPYDFANGDSHTLNFGNNDDPIIIGFWGYAHNNGVPAGPTNVLQGYAAGGYPAYNTTMRVSNFEGAKTKHEPKYTLTASNAKPHDVWSDVEVTANKPFTLELVEAYFDRLGPSNSCSEPPCAETITLNSTERNQLASLSGYPLTNKAQYDNSEPGRFDSSDKIYALVYTEFIATPKVVSQECRSLQIVEPTEADDGFANRFMNGPTIFTDQNGFDDMEVRIEIDADPGVVKGLHWETSNSYGGLTLRDKYGLDKDDEYSWNVPEDTSTWVSGVPGENDPRASQVGRERLQVYALDENGDWLMPCIDYFEARVEEEPLECENLDTRPGQSNLSEYDLLAGEYIDINVEELINTENSQYFNPDGTPPIVEYCYSGEIDWNWSSNNIFPALAGAYELDPNSSSTTLRYDDGPNFREFTQDEMNPNIGGTLGNAPSESATDIFGNPTDPNLDDGITKSLVPYEGPIGPGNPIDPYIKTKAFEEDNTLIAAVNLADPGDAILGPNSNSIRDAVLAEPGPYANDDLVGPVAPEESNVAGALGNIDPNDFKKLTKPGCVTAQYDQTLNDVLPITEGRMTMRVISSPDICWDWFDVREPEVDVCLDLHFVDVTELDSTINEYSVDVELSDPTLPYRVQWVVMQDGTTDPVLDVTNDANTINLADEGLTLDPLTTYTMTAQVLDVPYEGQLCEDELTNIPDAPECLDLHFVDATELDPAVTSYTVDVTLSHPGLEYRVKWTIEREGETDPVLEVYDGLTIDLAAEGYTHQDNDVLYAEVVDLPYDGDVCEDDIKNNPENPMCLDVHFVGATEFDPEASDYEVDVTLSDPSLEYDLEWTVEQDGSVRETFYTNTDALDLEDEGYEFDEDDDTLTVAITNLEYDDHDCEDEITYTPIGECVDLQLDTNEFDPENEDEYCVEVDTTHGATYGLLWELRDYRGRLIESYEDEDADDCIDIDNAFDDYKFDPGDRLYVTATDIENDEDCRDNIRSEEEEVCEDLDLYNWTTDTDDEFSGSDQLICVDTGDYTFEYVEVDIDNGEDFSVDADDMVSYVGDEYCFWVDEEDLIGATEIEVSVPGEDDCEAKLVYEPEQPDFDKNIGEIDSRGSNYFVNRSLMNYTQEEVLYEIMYQYNGGGILPFVDITDSIGIGEEGNLYGYLLPEGGIEDLVRAIQSVTHQEAKITYKSNSMEITINNGNDDVPHCSELDEEELETEFCYVEDIGQTRGVQMRNVPSGEQVRISYIGEITSNVNAENCTDPNHPFNTKASCGEYFHNTASYSDSEGYTGWNKAEIFIPCPFLIIRAGGEVLLEEEFETGIDTLACAGYANVDTPIIKREPEPIRRVVSTGGEEATNPYEALDTLCDEDIEGYGELGNISSLICEVTLKTDVSLSAEGIAEAVKANIAKLARYDKNLNGKHTDGTYSITDVATLSQIDAKNNLYILTDADLFLGDGFLDLAFDDNPTFIVIDHNVTINENITSGLATIIVVNGSINIGSPVEETRGIFLAIQGENENSGQVCEIDCGRDTLNSKTIYTHTGAIFGDPGHIVKNRVATGGHGERLVGGFNINYSADVYENISPVLMQVFANVRSQVN